MRLRPFPAGLVGAAGGAVGALPLLPIASDLATRYASPPALPGALRRFGDVKEATWAEAAVLLVAVPIAAFLFGRLLPSILERRAARGSLRFEWMGAGFAASFFFTQRGWSPAWSLAAGAALALIVAAAIALFRRSFSVRRLFSRRGRRALLSLALAGPAIDFARRAGPGAGSGAVVSDLGTELLLSALLAVLLGLAACRLFRSPHRGLRRLGAAAPWAIALSAGSLLAGKCAPVGAAIALASLPVAASLGKSGRVRRGALAASLLLLVFACAWRVRRAGALPIEPFEDGCSLALAQAYLHGARPYVETYPLHGWGSDGGVDAAAFRIFGPTLRVYRLRVALWSSVSEVLLAVASVAALGSGVWGVLGYLFSGSFTQALIDRQALALASLALLFVFARSRSRTALAAAGAFAGWTLLYGLDFGLILILGASVALLLLPTLEARMRRVRLGISTWALFLGGAVAGSLPFLLSLAVRGALDDFMRISFFEIPRWVTPAWGLPAPSVSKALFPVRDFPALSTLVAGVGTEFFFVMALLGIAAAALLLRASAAELEPEDRAAWIAICVAAFGLRGVLGRADSIHLGYYAIFAGVPAVWLLRRAWRSSARGALFLLALIFLVMRLHPFTRVEDTINFVVAAAKAAPEGLEPPRGGGERLPVGQAKSYDAFRRAIDARLPPDETFFDFSNQPVLYFFADRVPPVRYHTVAQYELPEKQREVLRILEVKKPALVVYTETFYWALDGVSNVERAPEVARYLAEHYDKQPGDDSWRLALRKPGRAERRPASSQGAQRPRP